MRIHAISFQFIPFLGLTFIMIFSVYVLLYRLSSWLNRIHPPVSSVYVCVFVYVSVSGPTANIYTHEKFVPYNFEKILINLFFGMEFFLLSSTTDFMWLGYFFSPFRLRIGKIVGMVGRKSWKKKMCGCLFWVGFHFWFWTCYFQRFALLTIYLHFGCLSLCGYSGWFQTKWSFFASSFFFSCILTWNLMLISIFHIKKK